MPSRGRALANRQIAGLGSANRLRNSPHKFPTYTP